MSLPLRDLSAIVTGAGRGLGRAEALELARLGAAVVVNDYGQPGRDGSGEASAAPAERVAEEIRAAGGRAVAHTGDVSDFEVARSLVELATCTYGRLDILVNNAGILRDRMIFSMSEDEWDSVIRVHLKGHFNTTHFASAHWRERAKASGGPVHGRIVNTSSEAFLAGSAGQPNYAAAKGGIVGLTTSTALALRRYGVTANAICPRARTRMTEDVFAGLAEPAPGELDPLAPEHVAPLVGYLASPAASRITGQLLVVHGGMVAVVERPRVAAQFDSAGESFSHQELEDVLGSWYAHRAPDETFAASEVLSLKRA
ncbi:3-oxoacyl-ACP reductase [Streptomyces pacificus]|uniref:3-oxoacyl-ACP reductase n=1 Tax=Streptomyces pacificus TaxID=2705029 RepID=A0A6A0AQ85_9ACTN|nr:3-oxoacyl-ACP reductase [Streptomyces pacificus]GFH34411.1 3-oxoacyl-ACP reductase [Streptomyces pacificus]